MSSKPAFFNYDLPKERIAQRPVSFGGARDSSKLLHVERFEAGGLKFHSKKFTEVLEILKPGDLLVLNNSKVLPWRFFLKTERSETEFEALLCGRVEVLSENEEIWEGYFKPLRKLKAGDRLNICRELETEFLSRSEDETKARIKIKKIDTDCELTIVDLINKNGLPPIPPYIRKGKGDEIDRGLYQTVYASASSDDGAGSLAAPTAGLHFTEELLSSLKSKGVLVEFVTLHVGPASFIPVRDGDFVNYKMPEEFYEIPEGTAEQIFKAKAEGRRVVGVGTTTCRALESWALSKDGIAEMKSTKLFINPGFDFKVIDALFTNFHQPQTTHLLIVAALIGEEGTADAYQFALANDFRFLSYGDSMLIEQFS
jgi:S-adenosylmethionine:tRNA ribosyltransferase-isomerase